MTGAQVQRRIGCLIYTRGTFWDMLAHGVQERASKSGVAVEVQPAFDVDGQDAILKKFIDQRVDALVLGVVDPERAARILRKHSQLPIIGVVAEMPTTVATANVCIDDIGGCAASAEFLIGKMGGQGAIAHLQGNLQLQTGRNRSDGFRTVARRYPQISIAYEAPGSDWSFESGQRLMRAALEADPTISGVFAASDPLALGALDVISKTGRAGSISVVGFDGQPDAMAAIYDGRLAATVDQPSFTIGWTAADAAIRCWEGEQPEPMITIATKLITAENLTAAAIETVRLMPGLFESLMSSSEAQRQLQEEIIEGQRALIRELSTPILPLTDDILALPLVGSIDTARAQRITEMLLETISSTRTRAVIIDISGVPIVDTGVANHLLKAATAARLLGAMPILVGVSPELAHTIVQLGIDLSSLRTFSTMSAGLAFAQSTRAHAAPTNTSRNRATNQR